MTLTEAKAIADSPSKHSAIELREAYDRLSKTDNGRMRTRRAWERLDNRLANLLRAMPDHDADRS